MTSIREMERNKLEQQLMAIAERNEARSRPFSDDIPDFSFDRDAARRNAAVANGLTLAACLFLLAALLVAVTRTQTTFFTTSYTGDIHQIASRKK